MLCKKAAHRQHTQKISPEKRKLTLPSALNTPTPPRYWFCMCHKSAWGRRMWHFAVKICRGNVLLEVGEGRRLKSHNPPLVEWAETAEPQSLSKEVYKACPDHISEKQPQKRVHNLKHKNCKEISLPRFLNSQWFNKNVTPMNAFQTERIRRLSFPGSPFERLAFRAN